MTTGRVVRLLLVAGDDRDLPGRHGAKNVGGGRLHVHSVDGAALLVEFGAARMLAAVHALLLGAAELLAELVDGDVERRELVVVDGLGPDDRTLAGQGQFHGRVLHATVVIRAVSDFDLETLRARREVLDPGHLLLDDSAEAIRNAHSHTDDAGIHP